MSVSIQKNLNKILTRIREPAKLMVVSKNRSIDDIKIVLGHSQKNFGENKVQELLDKSQKLADESINWHFIGHLQSNKINSLLKVKNLVAIHSIDSLTLLNKLISKDIDHKIGIFLQFNISNEIEKSGFTNTQELINAIELLKYSRQFFLQGLMTIGPRPDGLSGEEFTQQTRKCFSELESLKEVLDKSHSLKLELSMGMSQDFEIAQEFSTNWLRIGTEIFGVQH